MSVEIEMAVPKFLSTSVKGRRQAMQKKPIQPAVTDSLETENKPTKEILKATFMTWNVEGKGQPEDIDKAVAETFKEALPDIVCLQNAKLLTPGEGTKNYEWLGSGACGSAVLIKKNSTVKHSSFDRLCDEICVVDLKGNNDKTVKVISCYVPPSSDYRSEELWTTLSELVKAMPTNMPFILAGDLNAFIGHSDTPDTKMCIGRKLHHEQSNDNGVKLKGFARAAYLRVTNTLNKQLGPEYSKVTYKTSDVETQQDYILTPNLRGTFAEHLFNKWHKEYNHAMLGCRLYVVKMDGVYHLTEGEEIQQKLAVSTWNIQGATPAKVDKVISEHSLPIVCVQDIFVTSEDDLSTDHYKWLHSKKQWTKNVGILVRTSPDIKINNFEAVSECLCVADITFYDEALKVISCFFPPAGDSRLEAVTTQLVDVLKQIPKDVLYVIGGHFSIDLPVKYDALQVSRNLDNTIIPKLGSEVEADFSSKPYTFWARSQFLTQSSNTNKKIVHLLLLPPAFVKSTRTRSFTRLIPFFANKLECILLEKKEEPGVPYHSGHRQKILNGSTEPISSDDKDKGTRKVTTFEYLDYREDDVEEGSDVSSLPPEFDKFKGTDEILPDKELEKLFEDFVLFYKTDVKSNNVYPAIFAICTSIKDGQFGRIEMEEEIKTSPTENSRTVRVKFNGVLLAKESVKHLKESADKLLKKAGGTLAGKLGQFFPTVKSKMTYYNKGFAPMLDGDPKLDKVFKKVGKKEFPTIADVTKHIDEFFAKDTDCELAFGPDFTDQDLIEIRNYAKGLKLGYRFFASSLQRVTMDYIALYKTRSPQEIRDKVLEDPNDMRYYLIPPCGVGKDYRDFQNKIEASLSDEQKIIQEYHLKLRQSENDTKGQNGKAGVRKNQQSQKARPFASSTPRNGPQNAGGRPQYDRANPFRSQNRNAASYNTHKDASRTESSRNEPSRNFYSENRGGNKRQMDRHNPFRMGTSQARGEPDVKRQRLNEESHQAKLPRLNRPRWREYGPLVVVYPITVRSTVEDRAKQILEANFPTEFLEGPQNKVAVMVTLPKRYRNSEETFCLAVDVMPKAARDALQQILSHSTILKPNPMYLCDGGVPNFVRYKVPCQTNPRSYIIIDRYDTGPLTEATLYDMLLTFKESFNEEIFFDKDSYTVNEKTIILNMAPKFNLGARHFGDDFGLLRRYVCVYKMKPTSQILEEVLKKKHLLARYMMASNKLPPSVALNVF